MKIILKYIFTNVRERKTRTAVMLLSILLSATLLFVSFSIGASYESAQRKMARGMAGSATISIRAVNDVIRMEDLPQLTSIEVGVGMIKGSALFHENGYYETIDLIAADLQKLNQINPPRLTDGSEITDFEGMQVILPERFTTKYGIKEGDSITLQIGGMPIYLEVAAIAAYDTIFLRHTRGATALLPMSTLSEILEIEDGYTEILIKPVHGMTTSELSEELHRALPDEEFQVSEVVNEKQIAADARQKSMPFFLISFFSLTMSVFIIYSSYKVITVDRLPVIGTFRSIGASQRRMICILLLESIVYGVLGGKLGIPSGILILKLILQGMGQNLSQSIEIPVVISRYSILFSFMVAVMVSIFSAWIPVWRASRLPIKDVVLGNVEEKHVSNRVVVAIGVILFMLSVVLPELVSGKMLYPAGGFSLLGLIVATILIVPLLVNGIATAFEHFYGAIFGNVGRLAARNMKNNKNVAQNIILLFISISAVIAISVVGNFVTSYISDVFKGAEMQGFVDGHMDAEFVEQIKKMEGIDKVLPLYVYKNQIRANGITLSRMEATEHLDWYSSMLAIHYTKEEMMENAIPVFDTEKTVLLSESCMNRTGFAIGDTITLSSGSGEADYQVFGSFKSRATDVEAVISFNNAVSDFEAATYDFLAYTATDPDAIMVQIRDLFGEQSNWSRTIEEFQQDAFSTVGAFLQPMHSMTYFILLLATVGIINNLLINYIQKRKSIAMYKSVGLSNRQNMQMTLLEGFSSGLIGACIAILASYMEIRTIFLVAGPKISMAPELDASTFLEAGGMGVVVTLLGSVVPVIKSRHMKLVEEIKFE